MSATALPITPGRFAAALPDLSLPLLHAKAAEIHNSIAHLLESNKQLEPEREDADCAAAILENEEVIARMRERLDILKIEVEGRGSTWVWGTLDQFSAKANGGANGEINGAPTGSSADGNEQDVVEMQTAVNGTSNSAPIPAAHEPRRLDDEELARRIRQQMDELEEDEDGGMHL